MQWRFDDQLDLLIAANDNEVTDNTAEPVVERLISHKLLTKYYGFDSAMVSRST